MNSSTSLLSQSEQERHIEKLEIFKIQGRDKRGRKVLRIIGKLFPAKVVNVEELKKYMEEKIFPSLGEQPFSVVYVHTGVQRRENFPGISALRSIYEALPINIKDHLKAVYFLHPGLNSRLFLATFGRILFGAGLYRKLKYVSRLEFLWDQVRRNEVKIPEFVYDHDEKLQYHPMMDYGLESDHPRVYCAPTRTADSPFSMYSMSGIEQRKQQPALGLTYNTGLQPYRLLGLGVPCLKDAYHRLQLQCYNSLLDGPDNPHKN